MNQPTTPRANDFKPATSWSARLVFGIVLLIVLGAMSLFFVMRSSPVRVPELQLAGLDPAVEREIESSLKAVRASPRSADAWGRLGSVLMHYEFPAEMLAAFAEAERLDPQSPRWPHFHGLAISATDIVSATERFRRAATLAGNSSDAPRLHLAQALAERGLNAEAGAEFQSLLLTTPRHAPARIGLARLRFARGQNTDATNYLHACLDDPHTRRSAHTLLAAAEKALGNSSAAAATARAAASFPPDVPWPDPWWTDALVYRVGRKAQLEDATALMDEGNAAAALQLLRGVTDANPSDAEAWYLSGWVLNQMGRSDEAERALRLHLRLTRESVKGHAQLAVALLSQKRPAEAVTVLDAAIALKPTWRELRSNLGFALVQLGRDAEALVQFRESLALDPNYLPTYIALAELLNRRGERAEALRLLRQAGELAPEDARVRALLQRMDSPR